jgi:hypothetical protein
MGIIVAFYNLYYSRGKHIKFVIGDPGKLFRPAGFTVMDS